MGSQARIVISESLAAIGAVAPDENVGRCADIAVWLAPKAARLGLTQFVDGEQLALELMAPGFPLIPSFLSRGLRVAEVGAGSGALGLALAALCPTVAVTLIDRRKRAAGFIELCVRRFALENVDVVCDDLRTHEFTYDWVVARALAPGNEVVRELWGLCSAGGHIALIETGDVRRAPAGLRRSSVLSTAIEGLRVHVYEAARPAG